MDLTKKYEHISFMSLQLQWFNGPLLNLWATLRLTMKYYNELMFNK